MSDTPRMNAARNAAMEHMTGDVWRVGCQLERELNAANSEIERLRKANLQLREGAEEQKQRIKRLEEMYEGVIGEQPELLGSNVMGLLKRELNDTQRRIKRLEEAGDEMEKYCSDYYSSNKWYKAKEAKP